MDEEEQDELLSYFQSCDKNGDGVIEFSEFVTLLKNLGTDMGAEESRIGFAEVDSDGDGSIDLAEFRAWWEDH